MSLPELWELVFKPVLVGLGTLIVLFAFGAVMSALLGKFTDWLKENVQFTVPKWLDTGVKVVLFTVFVWALGMLITGE